MYRIPCLSVRGKCGNLSYLPFDFQMTNEDKPLRIAVTDDTPNGSGKELRDNLWLAAITATMLRNETLHGVKISVEFEGNVDGPSAGAISCLAILSAMSGLTLPNDFAMTGSIFPDGTIGDVGGIVEKITAAAQNGKKRVFIPGYRRMILDAEGQLVDIVNLAEELNITLIQVENIEDAFSIVYNKPFAERKYVNEKYVTAIPRETEELLKKEYATYETQVRAIIENTPDENVAIICQLFEINFCCEKLFVEGRFPAAVDQIISDYANFVTAKNSLAACQDLKYPIFGSANKLLEKIHLRNAEYVDDKIEKMWNRYEERLNKTLSADFCSNHSPISAQLEKLEEYPLALAIAVAMKDRYESVKDIKLSKEQFENEKLAELLFLHIGTLVILSDEEEINFYEEIAKTLPDKRPNLFAPKVENLFKTAHVATINAAFSAFSPEEYQESTALQETCAVLLSQFALKYHEDIHAAGSPDYHVQVSMKLQVLAFVKSAVLLAIKYKEISSDFTKILIRNARDNALKNMSECVNCKIPCLEPIRAFQLAESAEFSKDNFEDVLENYWFAGLYAKALLISFK